MKIFVAIFALCFFCISLFGQDTILPTHQSIIGNRTHTSRDVLNGALTDSEQNLYLIGSTENDFTYNDITIIKLNQDLDVLWEESISFGTNLSYDRVVDSYMNRNDELIIVCKSAFNKFSETPVVIKMDKNGNLLWQLAFENLSEPLGMIANSLFSTLESNEHLTVGFKLYDQNQENPFVLYSITDNGQIAEQNTINELYGTQKFPITPISSDGTLHYAITRAYNQGSDSGLDYKLVRFDDEELISRKVELDEIRRSILSENSEIILDNNNLPIWIDYPNRSINGVNYTGFTVHYFDTNGIVTNFIQSETEIRRYVLGRGFDSNNNLIVISESVSQETLETLGLLMEKYAPDGMLIDQVLFNESVTGYQALIQEGQIVVQLEDKSLNIYTTDFEFVNNIKLDPGGAINYVPLSMHNIGNETFIAAQKEASIYEGSDFLGQRDFNIKKVSNSTEIKDFTFSGKGTSKTWINWIQKADNDEYLIHITDKLGPDNLQIGGSRSKEYNYDYYYDSDLAQKRVIENVPRVSWKHPPEDQVDAFDLDGSLYQYKYNSDSRTFSLERNNEILWSKQWNEDNSDVFYDFQINSEGSLILRNSYNKLIKLTLDGVMSFIQTMSGPIYVFKVLDNDWIFTHSDSSMLIYSPDFELISEKESYDQITYDHRYYTPSFHIGNRVLFTRGNILSTNYKIHEMHVYDQYGNLENIYYFHGNLRERYAFLDGNDLVTLTDDGAHIDHGFSWNVAVINKYENFVDNVIKDDHSEDSDGDGIPNFSDYCENTPQGNPVDEHGCNLYDIDNLNFALKTVGETCYGKEDGKIIVTAIQDLNYTVIVVNNDIEIVNQNFSYETSFDGLAGGSYKICITVAEISEFEQCFDVYIPAVEQLYVESIVSEKNNSVALKLEGGKTYTIQINDETFSTSSSSVDIPLKDPYNKIVVKTGKDCQGIFEENIILNSKNSAYPNPTTDGIFHIYLGNEISQPITCRIFSQNGRFLRETEVIPRYGTIKADISDLTNGQYFFVIELGGAKVPYRIIKR